MLVWGQGLLFLQLTEMYFVNGQLQSSIDLADRGFQYGDGLFETLLLVNGQPLLWGAHLRRMQLGCQKLAINYTVDSERLLSLTKQLLGLQPTSHQSPHTLRRVLKLIVTRGSGGRGYRPTEGAVSEVMGLFPPPNPGRALYSHGVDLRSLKTPVSENSHLAGLKHLNRLDQVMASLELKDDEFEGIMHNEAGELIEGTKSNVFIRHKGSWLTPDLKKSGIRGVLRDHLILKAPEWGIQVDQAVLGQAELAGAEAMVILNSVFGVIPVRSFNHKLLDVNCAIKEIQEKVHQELPYSAY